MQLRLVTFTANNCTVGKLYDEHNELLCCTIEKPWLNNEPNKSCIPTGSYHLKPVRSPKFGDVYYLENEFLDVSLKGETKRTHILIHAANKASELLGCIAVGRDFSVIDGEWAITNSKKTLSKLLSKLDAYDHVITIIRN